jgi:hypothetical protein
MSARVRGGMLALALACLPASASAQGGRATLEKLKFLEDQWIGIDSERTGQPWLATYRVVAGGSVVMETIYTRHVPDMVSMYYLDGERLLLDHYCFLGNQPRMQAATVTADPNVVTFQFLGITNLLSPMANHDHGLVMSFEDSDHYMQDWTFRWDGKDSDFVWHFRRARRGEVAWLEGKYFMGQVANAGPRRLAVLLASPLIAVALLMLTRAKLASRFSKRGGS